MRRERRKHLRQKVYNDGTVETLCGQFIDANNVETYVTDKHLELTCRKCRRRGNGIDLIPYIEALRAQPFITHIRVKRKNKNICEFCCTGFEMTLYFKSPGIACIMDPWEYGIGDFTDPDQLIQYLKKQYRKRLKRYKLPE